MNIVIYGAGALGTFLGVLLSKKNRVKLIGRGEHIKKIKEHGVKLRGYIEGTYRIEVEDDVGELDHESLIIVSTKLYDLENSLIKIRDRIKGNIPLLLIQNGIDVKEIATSIIENPVIRAITGMGAQIIRPGEILTSWGKVVIEDTPLTERIYYAFKDCDISIKISKNIKEDEWFKLCINAFVNPLTAILRVENSLLVDENIRWIIDGVVKEVMEVASQEGIKIEEDRVKRTIKRLKSYKNYSSMYQDIKRKKRTEIDFINGEIIRRGESYGIETNFNKILYNMVKFLEKYGYK